MNQGTLPCVRGGVCLLEMKGLDPRPKVSYIDLRGSAVQNICQELSMRHLRCENEVVVALHDV